MNISKAIAWLIKLESDLLIKDHEQEFETISVTEKKNHITIKRFLKNGQYITNEQPIKPLKL